MPNATINLIQIPAGTKPSRCEGPHCQVQIYKIPHPSTGRRHPVSVNVGIDERCIAPSQTSPGLGISHMADCPDAELFRSRRGAGVPRHARAER